MQKYQNTVRVRRAESRRKDDGIRGSENDSREKEKGEDILNRGLRSLTLPGGDPLVVTVAATKGPGRDVAGRDTGKEAEVTL